MKRRNALDVIDDYVADLMKRRPQEVNDLMAFVDHLGTLSEAELEVERETAARRGAKMRGGI